MMMPRGPKPGTSNNPSGNARDGRNNTMTSRERRALDEENSGSGGRRAAVVAGRAIQARLIGRGRG